MGPTAESTGARDGASRTAPPQAGPPTEGPLAVIGRLLKATNRHNLDELVECFAEDYINETPAHPTRGFAGREQVRRNWKGIFAAVPDLEAQISASTADGGRVWSELRMSGTRRDGTPYEMAGVILFTVQGTWITAARFYLEPVDHHGGTADDAVRVLTAEASQP